MHRYFTELIGTFFLTLAISLGNPIPIGLILMAMIYMGAHVSGAHYNPAISLGIFMRNRLNLNDLMLYILFQVIGAFLALWVFNLITETTFAPELSADLSLGLAFTIEGLFTFVLCITALTVMLLERYRNHVIAGFVIGLTLMGLAFLNGIYNPAVAGAALMWNMIQKGSFVGVNPSLIYVVSPLVGGLVASYIYYFLNERIHTTDMYR